MTIRQASLLLLLRQHAKKPSEREVRSLSTVMAIPKPSVSRNADRLEERGLVVRESVPNDRRLMRFTLTHAGAVLAERIAKGWPEA